ncbi:MAG: hypothetical protein HOO90_01005 [Methylotenera sp.]|uniref:hypothetical protein n=1 Tax=Methylotenera sp. TaxID=2051956 RepID=UPI0017BC72BA|nr:hypothetical protein [Methylotenera sp.]NOU24094.1 hypothetical protein [Methylotenera sp.]
MSDTCIHTDGGQIVFFPLMGCSQDDNKENNNQMYGVWENGKGLREKICWRYERFNFVYTKDRSYSFNPDEISTECDPK